MNRPENRLPDQTYPQLRCMIGWTQVPLVPTLVMLLLALSKFGPTADHPDFTEQGAEERPTADGAGAELHLRVRSSSRGSWARGARKYRARTLTFGDDSLTI